MNKLKDKHMVYFSDEMYTPIHYKGIMVEQPFFQGKGNHSVAELEAICEQYKDYVHQQSVIKNNCMKHIVELKFGVKLEKDCIVKTSSEFIVEKITELVLKYPQTKYRYEFNKECLSHYIEVKPNSFFESNDDFKNDEKIIMLEFLENFPCEGVLFFAESKYIEIENPIYKIIGLEFKEEK